MWYRVDLRPFSFSGACRLRRCLKRLVHFAVSLRRITYRGRFCGVYVAVPAGRLLPERVECKVFPGVGVSSIGDLHSYLLMGVCWA